MPATSKKQRRAAGMAMAIKRGEMEGMPGSPAMEMSEMEEESLEHFAKTKEKGLPMKKGKTRKPQGTRRAGYNKKVRTGG